MDGAVPGRILMDSLARLAQEADLDDDARKVLHQLGAEHVEALAATFADARARQGRQLDEAIDNGLRLVPRLVRPAITKILFVGTSDSARKADSSRLPTASARPDAELVKLARDLGVDGQALHYLQTLGGGDLMLLRHQLVDRLDRDHRPMFGRLALSSTLLPTSLSVQIGVRFFGPMLCGRLAAELSEDRALKLLNRVPMDFLVACAPFMDPARSADVTNSIPLESLVAVTRGLQASEDHITLGRYVTVLETATLIEVVRATYDPEDLFWLSIYAEGPAALTPVFAALSDEQVDAVRAVAKEHNELEHLESVISGTVG
jgi:hypothetical protein